jgi:hypothetical protein
MSASRSPTVDVVLRAIVRGDPTEHVVPAVAAATWSLALTAVAASGLATQRGLVFVMGPLVLLATLHARTGGYLHAPGHLFTFALPIDPRARFVAARARHLRALAVSIAWGVVAIAVAVPALGRRDLVHAGLVLDWLALGAFAACIEPFAAATAAFLGRRLPAEHPGTQMQKSLGGGWTLPEAVVHLYAPALGLGLAIVLALPVQLATDLSIDGGAPGRGLLIACAAAGGLAVALGVVAPALYRGGVFESIPWLAEATRTLAGPPVPEPAPGWIVRLRDPRLRLALLQHQRLTPLPRLRLWALLGVAIGFAVRGKPLAVAHMGVLLGLVALWIVPALALVRQRERARRALGAMPVSSRRGVATALLVAPAVVAIAIAVVGSGSVAGGAP